MLLSLSGWWCVKCALSFLALILKNLACKDFTCLATVSLHMHKNLAPKMVVCLSPYCMINNSSLAKDFFLSHILHAKSIPFWRPYFIFHICTSVFFGKGNFHRKCQFPFIDLTKLPINKNNVMFISLLCPIHLHCDPRKSSIFPIFVIFVIYRPRFCPFVHFVIALYILSL